MSLQCLGQIARVLHCDGERYAEAIRGRQGQDEGVSSHSSLQRPAVHGKDQPSAIPTQLPQAPVHKPWKGQDQGGGEMGWKRECYWPSYRIDHIQTNLDTTLGDIAGGQPGYPKSVSHYAPLGQDITAFAISYHIQRRAYCDVVLMRAGQSDAFILQDRDRAELCQLNRRTLAARAELSGHWDWF
jgi:hypothetical protein